MTDQEYTPHVEAIIRSFVPQWTTTAKAHSSFMKTIGWVLGLIGNTTFMTSFWTTVGYTTYTSSDPNDNDWITCAHEGKHTIQSQKLTRPLMSFLYLLPIPLVFSFIGCFFLPTWWASILGIVAVGCLAPLPAFFRMRFELEAYEVTLACWAWRYGFDSAFDQVDWVVSNFTTGAYYWMWPFTKDLTSSFNLWLSVVRGGGALSDPYLKAIYNDLKSRDMLYAA